MKDWTGNSVAYRVTAGHDAGNREEHDYYATDPKAAELLLGLDNFNNIWECACGGGSSRSDI